MQTGISASDVIFCSFTLIATMAAFFIIARFFDEGARIACAQDA
jgi:hypothetical protein